MYWAQSLWPGSVPSMFGPLVALTFVLLTAQGAFELFVRREPLGAVLIAVAFLIASVGATAAPYVRDIERRRRGRER